MTRGRKIEFAAVALVWALLWPLHELIALWISYPMRRLAAELVAVVLGVFGYQVSTEFTAITLEGSSPIVIADACSGVEGTIALLFIGWIVARLMQPRLALAAVHYLFALPSVILANVARLVLTVFGYSWFGEAVLASGCHRMLGYFQLVLAFIIYYLSGKVVKCVE